MDMNVEKIRKDFPVLDKKNAKMIENINRQKN